MIIPRYRRTLTSRTKRNKRFSSVLDHQALRKESRALSDSIIVLRDLIAEKNKQPAADYFLSDPNSGRR